MASNKQKIIVKQVDDANLKIPFEIIAGSIVKIANYAKDIKNSRLTEDAILTLMKDKTHLPKATIKSVIDNLADLERQYVRK